MMIFLFEGCDDRSFPFGSLLLLCRGQGGAEALPVAVNVMVGHSVVLREECHVCDGFAGHGVGVPDADSAAGGSGAVVCDEAETDPILFGLEGVTGFVAGNSFTG